MGTGYVVTVVPDGIRFSAESRSSWRNWIRAEKVTIGTLDAKLREVHAKDLKGTDDIEFDTEADAVMWLLKYS